MAHPYSPPDTLGMGLSFNAFHGQPQGLAPYRESAMYNNSPFGNRMAQGGIGQLLMMLMGKHMYPLPQPGSNQTVYDAFWRRSRDMEQLQLRNSAVANMMLFQRMGGINQNSMLFQMASGFVNNPDGPFARAMAPLIGGNPILANQGAFANMRGFNMSTFGTTQDATAKDINDMQQAIYGRFYNHRRVSDLDVLSSKTSLLENVAKNKGLTPEMKRYLAESGFDSKNGVASGVGDNLRNAAAAIPAIQRVLNERNLETMDGKESADQKAKELLNKLTDGPAKQQLIAAVADALKKGSAESFRSGTASIQTVASQMEMHAMVAQDMQSGKMTPYSLNYKNTYGFNIEDLQSAAYTAAASKLLDGRKGISASTDAFMMNAPRTLDAARGLFGNNLSGKELVQRMDQFVGVSNVDLASAKGQAGLETAMRDLKALAVEANVSVEALLDMISQAKSVAASHPGLRQLGGVEIAKMVTDATIDTMAMSTMMDNGSIRRAGGIEGLLQQNFTSRLGKAAEPISQWTGALHSYFSADPQAQAKIREWAKTGDHTTQGFNNFVVNLTAEANRRGANINQYDVMSYAQTNAAGAALGLRDNPELGEVGTRATTEQFRKAMYRRWRDNPHKGQAALNAVDLELLSRDVNYSDYLSDYKKDVGEGGSGMSQNLAEQVLSGLKTTGYGSMEEFMAAPESEKQKTAATRALSKNALDLSMLLRQRVNDQFDERGNVISDGRRVDSQGNAVGRKSSFLQKYANFEHKTDLSKAEAVRAIGDSVLAQQASDFFRTGAATAYKADIDPDFKKRQEAARTRVKDVAEMTRIMDVRMAHLNSPMTTQLLNTLYEGKISEGGIKELFTPLGFNDSQMQPVYEYFEANKRIKGADTWEELKQALDQSGTKTQTVDTLDRLARQNGIGIDTIAKIGDAKDINEASKIIAEARKGQAELSPDKVAKLYQSAQGVKGMGVTAEKNLRTIGEAIGTDKLTPEDIAKMSNAEDADKAVAALNASLAARGIKQVTSERGLEIFAASKDAARLGITENDDVHRLRSKYKGIDDKTITAIGSGSFEEAMKSLEAVAPGIAKGEASALYNFARDRNAPTPANTGSLQKINEIGAKLGFNFTGKDKDKLNRLGDDDVDVDRALKILGKDGKPLSSWYKGDVAELLTGAKYAKRTGMMDQVSDFSKESVQKFFGKQYNDRIRSAMFEGQRGENEASLRNYISSQTKTLEAKDPQRKLAEALMSTSVFRTGGIGALKDLIGKDHIDPRTGKLPDYILELQKKVQLKGEDGKVLTDPKQIQAALQAEMTKGKYADYVTKDADISKAEASMPGASEKGLADIYALLSELTKSVDGIPKAIYSLTNGE